MTPEASRPQEIRPPVHADGAPFAHPAPTHVPLDPQLAAIVAEMRAANAPPAFSGSPQEARGRLARAILAAQDRTGLPEVGSTADAVADAHGLAVPVRIYRPGTGAPATALPTVVFFHGGGFVLGSVALMDDIARKLCRDLRAVVVSVDYRLAPEHPFPAAHDDALAATAWAVAHAPSLGGDAGRVAVAGESAGANLAAAAALSLRDRGTVLAGQLLIVPGLDLGRDLEAIAACGRDYPMLGAGDLADIARLYLGDRPQVADCFPASPLRVAQVAGAPPAVIAVAGHDPLRGEGLAYAERLRQEGVGVRVLDFPDMFHPFFGFFAASAAAGRASDDTCRAFAALLHGAGDASLFHHDPRKETP